jgi:hypothetical protein
MLLYTKKANNVFDFVYEKFGDRDISPSRASSPAGWLVCLDLKGWVGLKLVI